MHHYSPADFHEVQTPTLPLITFCLNYHPNHFSTFYYDCLKPYNNAVKLRQ